MPKEFHFCPGDCRQCDGIHVSVPVDSDDLHLVRAAARFSDRTNASIHVEDPGSIYPRGSKNELQAQIENIQAIAKEMGLMMHTRLNGAPSDKK